MPTAPLKAASITSLSVGCVCVCNRHRTERNNEVYPHRREGGNNTTYHHGELSHGAAGRHGVGALLDQVRGVQPDDVHAQDLLRLLVVQHLRNGGERD
jgi:hypothetical protein